MLKIDQGQIGEKMLPFHALPFPTLRILIKNNLNMHREQIDSNKIYF